MTRTGGCRCGAIRYTLSAEPLATRVISSVRVPYRISGEEISVSLSIGISIFPADTNEASALIKQADTAMYRAKLKKGMFCFHDER